MFSERSYSGMPNEHKKNEIMYVTRLSVKPTMYSKHAFCWTYWHCLWTHIESRWLSMRNRIDCSRNHVTRKKVLKKRERNKKNFTKNYILFFFLISTILYSFFYLMLTLCMWNFYGKCLFMRNYYVYFDSLFLISFHNVWTHVVKSDPKRNSVHTSRSKVGNVSHVYRSGWIARISFLFHIKLKILSGTEVLLSYVIRPMWFNSNRQPVHINYDCVHGTRSLKLSTICLFADVIIYTRTRKLFIMMGVAEFSIRNFFLQNAKSTIMCRGSIKA